MSKGEHTCFASQRYPGKWAGLNIIYHILQTQEHFFTSLVAEVCYPCYNQTGFTFESNIEPWGKVVFDGTEERVVLDGQHRLAAIREALKASPGLVSETIPVVLVPFRDLQTTRTLIGDLRKASGSTPNYSRKEKAP